MKVVHSPYSDRRVKLSPPKTENFVSFKDKTGNKSFKNKNRYKQQKNQSNLESESSHIESQTVSHQNVIGLINQQPENEYDTWKLHNRQQFRQPIQDINDQAEAHQLFTRTQYGTYGQTVMLTE